jgi:hypothetical protein
MISPNLDISGHEVWNLRVGASEHQIYARSLHIVVDDVERSGSIPAANCLRLGTDLMYVGDIRVNEGGFSTVENNSALNLLCFKSVNPQTIQYQMMRHARKISLITTAKPDEIVDEVGRTDRGDLEPNQLVMVGARISFDNRCGRYVGIQSCKQAIL